MIFFKKAVMMATIKNIKDELTKQQKENIGETINYYQQKHFSMVCKTNMSIEEFEKKVKEENPDIVFVDCVQNFKMPKSANFTEGMCILSKEIKKIATENNFGITDVVPLEYYDGIFYTMQKEIWI